MCGTIYTWSFVDKNHNTIPVIHQGLSIRGYVMGYKDTPDGTKIITSPIINYNSATKTIITLSGSFYKLYGNACMEWSKKINLLNLNPKDFLDYFEEKINEPC